ncbi:MAG: hypothetical protein JWN68_1894 [Nocardioides sp.]|uniref:hypothetical protein n=1 Tax=Nocardioides sp. TaxID=35761 RepID=UPI0026253488|nr:hypothetical protein [Nocardioides sp.]MCW2833941.1 hypothetical protein [Nocardioides sp.]
MTIGTKVNALGERINGVRGWRAHALLLVVFAILAAPFVVDQAVENTELSIFDEWQYLERVHQVSQGDLFMRNGEVLTEWAQDARTCRGIARLGPPAPPPCREGEPFVVANSAAADPPFYFVVTGSVAGVLIKTGLLDSPLVAGRLVGTLWAALSMWSLFLLARAVGAGRVASFIVSSCVLMVPALLQQYTFITPHALDIPVGAFAALATLRFLRREWPWWSLVLAGLAVAGVKGSNLVVVIGLGVTLLSVIVWPKVFDRSDRLRALIGGAVLAGSTLGFTVLWMVVLRLTQVADPPPPGDYLVESLPLPRLLLDSVSLLGPYGEKELAIASVWMMFLMAGSALAVWSGLAAGQAPFVRQLAPGYLMGAALGAIVLDLMVFLTTDQYIGILFRYGLAIWPIGLAFAALVLCTRTAQVMAVLALVAYASAPYVMGYDSLIM